MQVVLAEANDRVESKLERAGITRLVGPDNCVDSFAAAIARCDLLLGSSAEASRERQAVLSEHAAQMLRTSAQYLRGAEI
ncbi:MAG: hypothetical protein JNM98_14600 [Rhodocyclaceae bacterium]|nr:hypothetical protein [Rhodocyclaceae bacterium]